MHEKMYLLYNEEAEVSVTNKRTWQSVRNRFQKSISKSVSKFNAYYKQVKEKEESGWTPQMYIDAAMKVWFDMEKKHFKFGHWLPRSRSRPLSKLPFKPF